jgi:hypothetical protein
MVFFWSYKADGGRAWKLEAAEAVSKPRQSKRNPVGKVSLKGAGAGRVVATSSFFFGGDFLLSERRFAKKER